MNYLKINLMVTETRKEEQTDFKCIIHFINRLVVLL